MEQNNVDAQYDMKSEMGMQLQSIDTLELSEKVEALESIHLQLQSQLADLDNL